jgi:hypothetical protein
MQMNAIQFSRDPDIVEIRNKIGADEIFYNSDKCLLEHLRQTRSYDEVLESKQPIIVRERNYLGAKKLAPNFMQEVVVKKIREREGVTREERQAA